ncbi:T9SS type A sorting domain-containing protein [uncultured Chryseobacterium sp.]|uniref:T9SS type A sorting domain-containing protein n=1 Tax=uncultured Chryseobacterium sp. TaxID=259322 RepID=UPI0025CD31CF|nr:T9SS type A sorting domain-containing protein [uncultured Chryseobacterium sp.]
MKKLAQRIALAAVCILTGISISGQLTTVRINKNTTYQKITGFGGFVCSPQFGYNHMTTSEIQTLWGAGSQGGYNIMRLYIPEDSNNWSSVLATAQLAKSMGLTIFASPWTMPAAWKTNNSVNAVYTDANGVQQIGYLKTANYQDYALYLNSFVTYLQNNGVTLDYISIQNEPDEMAQYQGCIWTPTQIANFVRDYGQLINCKVIAPESVGLTDNFASAMLNQATMDNFEVYGGHQYGLMQSTYKQFQNYNKEIWQTEYLINWNPSTGTPRDFSWNLDAFNFASSINNAMLGNVNAWIHYSAKRYYALMGDGTNGTTTGVMTKRGYILSHYAKYTTGKTRIAATWGDTTGMLQGSSYISLDGNQVVLMVINPSANAYNLKVDLPFYSTSGTKVLTDAQNNMATMPITMAQTFRPGVTINASSVMTFVFNKSADRPVSTMTGSDIRYNKIETMTPTNSAFGTGFNISNTTATFSNASPLISTNTTAANGYLQLNDRYNKMVLHVNSFTTAGQSYSDNTTLYYINSQGVTKSYNYGKITFPTGGNFDITLDISRQVLTDGCKGILGLRNSNYGSILTLNLGDVYFNIGNEVASKFAGTYSDGDSNLMDALENGYYTSVDFRNTTGTSSANNWQPVSANSNSIYYVPASVTSSNNNVISGTSAANLVLSDQGKDFQVPFTFSASAASYSRTFNGFEMLLLPFTANIPSGVSVYQLTPGATGISCTAITNGTVPANIPVLVNATGTVTFQGTGNVSTPKAITVNQMNGVYNTIKVPANSYVLQTVNGTPQFSKVVTGSEPMINPFRAYLSEENTYTASVLPLSFTTLATENLLADKNEPGLYPSPAKNEIFIDLKTLGTASIFDAKGSLVIRETTLRSGKNRIDISHLPAGMYLVEISQSGNKSVQKKFIKQ